VPGLIAGITVRQTGRATVPAYLLGRGGEPPGSFLRHFWPIVHDLERFHWTPSLLESLRESGSADAGALAQLLRDDRLLPPRTAIPEFAWAVGGAWLDFYGFVEPPRWSISQWPLRCRGEGVDEAMWLAFRCLDGDCWTFHSRDEALLSRMKEAALRTRSLVVSEVPGLPFVADRITLFPRPAGG
jgi:hypothetical protein